jgi:hypothetical protein
VHGAWTFDNLVRKPTREFPVLVLKNNDLTLATTNCDPPAASSIPSSSSSSSFLSSPAQCFPLMFGGRMLPDGRGASRSDDAVEFVGLEGGEEICISGKEGGRTRERGGEGGGEGEVEGEGESREQRDKRERERDKKKTKKKKGRERTCIYEGSDWVVWHRPQHGIERLVHSIPDSLPCEVLSWISSPARLV